MYPCRSPDYRLFAWSLCLMLTVCGAQNGGAQNVARTEVIGLVNEAERRIDLGLLKEAENSLRPFVDAIRADAPLSSGYHRLTKLLAETYLKSNDYEEARQWAERCRTYLEEKNGALVSEQQHVAVLLAQIHEKLDNPKKAAKWRNHALTLMEKDHHGPLNEELEVTATLAKLLHVADDMEPLEKIRPRINRVVQSIERDYRRRIIDIDVYDRNVHIFADYLKRTGRPDDAIYQWQQLLSVYSRSARPARPDRIRQVEIWSEIADIEPQLALFSSEMKEYSDNLVALTKALLTPNETSGKGSNAIRSSSFVDRLNHLVRTADVHRRLAQVYLRDRRDSRAIESLTSSRQLYAAAIREFEEYGSVATLAEPDKDRGRAVEVAARQGLQDVTYRLYQTDFQRANVERALVGTEEVIGAIRKLHDLLMATLLDNDPRIFRLKTVLGGLYLFEQDFENALPVLVGANEYWMGRMPPEYQMRVQSLELLAEAERLSGSQSDARSHLSEALKISQQHLTEENPTLELKLMNHLGRVYAETGDDAKAEPYFDQVTSHARKFLDGQQYARGTRASAYEQRCNALRSNAALYTSHADFDQAADAYSELIEQRRLHKNLDDGEPDLVSDYIRLTDVHIAREDLTEIEKLLDVVAGNMASSDQDTRAKLRHQRAMFRFLRNRKILDYPQPLNKTDREAAKADREAAKAIWKKLLETQQTEGQPSAEQARTLHYLASTRFLDFSSEFDNWMNQRQQPLEGRSAPYDVQLENYKQGRKAYGDLVKEYREDKAKYDSELKQYRSTHKGDLNSLQREHQKLEKSRAELDVAWEALSRLRQQLADDHKLKEASERESVGRLGRNLIQILSEAESLARRAVETLEKLDGDRDDLQQLRDLALSNHTTIRRWQSLFGREEEEDGKRGTHSSKPTRP